MLTLDLDIKHPNRNIKHLNLLWSTRIDGISPERGDQIMNDAKNDNLNDPPGFPGKILKVSDFARAMTSFWSKKAPKLIQYQIFLSEIVFKCCWSSINPSEHEFRVKQTTSMLDLSSAHKIVGAEAPCTICTIPWAAIQGLNHCINARRGPRACYGLSMYI